MLNQIRTILLVKVKKKNTSVIFNGDVSGMLGKKTNLKTKEF